MTTSSAEAELIRQAFRGERPWSDLEAIGITVTMQGETWIVRNPRKLAAVLTPADIAQGLLAHQADALELENWASFVLVGDLNDLDIADDDAEGDALLNAIWDLAFRAPLSQGHIDAANRVLNRAKK